MFHNHCVPSLGCLTSHLVHTSLQLKLRETQQSERTIYYNAQTLILTIGGTSVTETFANAVSVCLYSIHAHFFSSSSNCPSTKNGLFVELQERAPHTHTHTRVWRYVYVCMCACTSPHSIISHPHIGQSEATSSSICALTFVCPLVPSERWLWYWTTRLSRCRLHVYTSWRRKREC